MNKICVGIYDEHTLLQEGICALICGVNDIEVTLKENSGIQLMNIIKTSQINILIINMNTLNTKLLNLVTQLNILYPKIKILIISGQNDEETIIKTVRAGANGFLTKDTDKNDLIEAIYTLRNGYDYFSKSITQLLLKKYISDIKEDERVESSGVVKNLSSREIEIVKLWGNSYTNKEISDKLFISMRTVESHKNHIMQKLNLKTAVDLVKFAIKNNLIEI